MIDNKLGFLVAIFMFFNIYTLRLNAQSDYENVKLDEFNNYAQSLYLSIDESELDYQVFWKALKGYYTLLNEGKIEKRNIITIVDFSKSSTIERMFVVDIQKQKIIFKNYVSHAVKTGKDFAKNFSNRPMSNKSSYGFFVTGKAYRGSKGYSLRINGMEYKINHNVRRRGVVFHVSDYASRDYIKRHGYLGRSHGCLGLPRELYRNIIDTIKDRSCLFVYYPDKHYLNFSKYLNNETFLDYFHKHVMHNEIL